MLIYNKILDINEDDVWAEDNMSTLLGWRYEIKKQIKILFITIKDIEKQVRLEKREEDRDEEYISAYNRDIQSKHTVRNLQTILLDCVNTRIEQLREERLNDNF